MMWVGNAAGQSWVYDDLLPFELRELSRVPYTGDVFTKACNWTTQPCKLLNDVWGWKQGERYFAAVGLANGIDLLDVTDEQHVRRLAWIPGPLNDWRDVKHVFTPGGDSVLYAISEYTPYSNCLSGLCQPVFNVTQPAGLKRQVQFTQGRISALVNASGPSLRLPLVAVVPWEDQACDMASNTGFLKGAAVLVPQGGCSFSQKVTVLRDLGAAAVIIIGDEGEPLFPGMAGLPVENAPFTMLVGASDGLALQNALQEGENVQVAIGGIPNIASPLYEGPEGLVIINFTNPDSPTWRKETKDFYFAHNVFTEFNSDIGDRPWLYVVGASDNNPGNAGFGDISNGGILVYDVSNPFTPVLVDVFNTSYIHDVWAQECGDRYILVAAAIYDDIIYVFDASDPRLLSQRLMTQWVGRQSMAHNIALSVDCTTLYATHEHEHEGITVWKFFETPPDFSVPAQYLGTLAINPFMGTLPHNVFVSEAFLYASYYTEGVAVWDISQPDLPILIAHQDTSKFTSGFYGVWGVAGFFDRPGMIYASDREEGLIIMQLLPKASVNTGTASSDDDEGDVNKEMETEAEVYKALFWTLFSIVLAFFVLSALGLIVSILVALYIKNKKSKSYQVLGDSSETVTFY